MSKFALWNNKGGVGKSFLTFALATEYALKFPARKVCVIDMCPQANVSEILLGGNGDGYSALNNYLEQPKSRRTVGGYFDIRLSQPDKPDINEGGYAVETCNSLPNNLFLVVGDPSLELQVQSINQIASVDLPQKRWSNVHKWVSDLQEGISKKLGDGDTTFFVDCNPSFATYTAQAILSCDSLIVPCTADGSSARAIDNVGKIIYGRNISEMYESVSFHAKAKQFGFKFPNIKSVVLNRYTTSSKRPSTAFQSMFEEIEKRAKTSLDVDNFDKMPDAHTVAIVCSEKALPISKIPHGPHQLKNGRTQVAEGPLQDYRKAMKKLLEAISE